MNYKKWYQMLPTEKKNRIIQILNDDNSSQKIMRELLDVPDNTDFWMSDRSERLSSLLHTYIKKEHTYENLSCNTQAKVV